MIPASLSERNWKDSSEMMNRPGGSSRPIQEEVSNRGLLGELKGTAMTTAIIMAAGIVTGLLSARALGPSGRGELTAITIWPATLLYGGSFGLAEATAYFTASRRNEADHVLVTGQSAAVALGVLISIIGWYVLPLVLGRQSMAAQGYSRFYLLFFSIPALSSLCACSWLQGAGYLREFNIARAGVHIATAVLMGVLVLVGLASVRTFLVAMLVGNAVTWLIALAAWGSNRGASPRCRRELMGPMFAYGAKVQLGSWSAAANLRLDQLMLSSLATSTSLGMYVVGVSYAGLLTTLPSVAGIVMLPRLVRACTIGTGGRTLVIWYRWVLWATAMAALSLLLVARAILPLLFGGAFTESVSLQALLIPSSYVLGMNQFLAIGFRGHGRPDVASRSEVVGLLVTLPLLAVLLPKYGIYAAAVTSLCAYTLSGTYLLWKAGEIVGSRRALWVLSDEDWSIAKRSVRTLASAIGLI